MAPLVSLGAAALRPAVGVGRAVDRRARRSLAGPARRAALAALDTTLSTLEVALTSPLAREAGERIVNSPLNTDVLEPMLQRALNSPEAERLTQELIDSRVTSALLRELPDNDELWRLIDEIAQSPAVTEAIGRQSLSFADQMAGVMRSRSRDADDRVERIARRLMRRRPPRVRESAGRSAGGQT